MKRLASHIIVAVVAFAVGTAIQGGGRSSSADAGIEESGVPAGASVMAPEQSAAPGVTGIGGVFFKSDDPTALREWYRTHLGLDSSEWGGYAFQWDVRGRSDEIGYTIWTPFPQATDYFSPGEQSFMVNYRVTDLAGLMEGLREAGAEIAGEIEQYPNGAFAWVLDPEGRKIELWEPIASRDDPYLNPGA
jgi:predicted enzyme related to lactoylglutathione lyase